MNDKIFEIIHSDSKRESFDDYEYNITKNGKLIAKYYHDYRGDDNWLEYIDGTKEMWPVGGITNFMNGGGPAPLILSKDAISFLMSKFP